MFPTVPADFGPEVKSLVAQKLEILYRVLFPKKVMVLQPSRPY